MNTNDTSVFNDPDVYSFRLTSWNYTPRYIIMSKQFILDKMNTIMHRLLGLNADDDLSTREPSRDKNGAYTILDDLGIPYENFNHLIYFLRMNRLDKEYHECAADAAIALGGFTDLDIYIANESKIVHRIPMHPSDDTMDEYEWTPVNLLNTDLAATTINKGYSCTGTILYNNTYPYLYYRKKKMI